MNCIYLSYATNIMGRAILPTPYPNETKIESLKDLGHWTRARRTAAKLRIDDAASLCGVSVKLLSELENGNRSVGMDKLMGILNGLGLTLHVTPRNMMPFMTAEEDDEGMRDCEHLRP